MVWRPTFFFLVLANLVLYAWTEGYFGPRSRGEPERLQQELHPERLHILGPAEASAAAVPAVPDPVAGKTEPGCQSISGITVTTANAIRQTAEALQWTTVLTPLPPPPLHRVLIPDLSSKALMEKKAAELRKLGITEFSPQATGDGHYLIQFGIFQQAKGAEELLQSLVRRGVKSARSEVRERQAINARIDISGPRQDLAQKLPEWIAPHANASLGDCAPAATEAKAEVKTEVKAEVKAEVKPDTKPEAKP